MRHVHFDEGGPSGGQEERAGRRERLDRHLDNLPADDAPDSVAKAWRDEAAELVDALVASCLPEIEGGLSPLSQDERIEAIARRVVDPNRSQLNRLARGTLNPTRHIR